MPLSKGDRHIAAGDFENIFSVLLTYRLFSALLHLPTTPLFTSSPCTRLSIFKRIDRAQLVRDLSVGLGVQKAMATFTQSRDYWALR